MRRFGRDWWAAGSAAVAGFAVVFTYLGPVVLDPVFNRFTPLPAGETRDDVLELAAKARLEVGEVYEVDASRRTTAANAYVTGIGRTKRVVLYDTLLKDFTPAETRLVVAHELGHVKHRDVGHGLLWLALVAPFGTLAVARAAERLQRDGATPVPAVALALALLAPALAAISNQLSRAIERRADAFALDLTDEPDAMVAFERRITLQNVGDPDPPRWQQVLLGSHPPTMERIGQALASGRDRTRPLSSGLGALPATAVDNVPLVLQVTHPHPHVGALVQRVALGVRNVVGAIAVDHVDERKLFLQRQFRAHAVAVAAVVSGQQNLAAVAELDVSALGVDRLGLARGRRGSAHRQPGQAHRADDGDASDAD